MADEDLESWAAFWRYIEGLGASLRKSRAVNVNSGAVREEARSLVQRYFRETRPDLVSVGLDEKQLEPMDDAAQELLRLANSRSRRTYYRSVLSAFRNQRPAIESDREFRIGHSSSNAALGHIASGIEQAILGTLHRLVPSASLSYEQAISDLSGPSRVSYRGSAVELREALREVLDHLAPDADVRRAPDFKLEKDAKRPTMKQKARFILKARGSSSGSISTSKDAIERVEEAVASLARSVYTRGSVATHIPATREEVLNLKMYVESVLAELLQVHSSRAPGA